MDDIRLMTVKQMLIVMCSFLILFIIFVIGATIYTGSKNYHIYKDDYELDRILRKIKESEKTFYLYSPYSREVFILENDMKS